MSATSGTAILGRVIQPDNQDLSPDAARFFLQLDFPPEDHARIDSLSAKAKAGTLSDDERQELDGFLFAADVVAMLQSKSRRALKRKGSA